PLARRLGVGKYLMEGIIIRHRAARLVATADQTEVHEFPPQIVPGGLEAQTEFPEERFFSVRLDLRDAHERVGEDVGPLVVHAAPAFEQAVLYEIALDHLHTDVYAECERLLGDLLRRGLFVEGVEKFGERVELLPREVQELRTIHRLQQDE